MFDNIRNYFTVDLEWFGRFIRPNADNSGPEHFKGDDIRVAIIELTLRLRRIEAYQRLMEMKRHRLLTPEGEQRMARLIFDFKFRSRRRSDSDSATPTEGPDS